MVWDLFLLAKVRSEMRWQKRQGNCQCEVLTFFPREQDPIGTCGGRRTSDHGKKRAGRSCCTKQNVWNSCGRKANCGCGTDGNGRGELRAEAGIWNCDRSGQAGGTCHCYASTCCGRQPCETDGHGGQGSSARL